jgi:ATP-dependent protease ClpP protease subunit
MTSKSNPIRCFDGNAQPYEPFWTFRNADQTDSGETELEIYGPISEFSWWGDEVTPKLFKDELYTKGKNGPVTVRLNSYGGDLIAASVMAATIRDYPGQVTVKVDGIAASAAVMVAISGNQVQIQASAYMMIHNPLVGLLGLYNVDDLKSFINDLKVIKDGIVEGYAAKTKMEAEKLSKLMNDETWMTASEAVAYGFADQVLTGPSKATAQTAQYANFMQSHYMNVPRALLEMSSAPIAPVVPNNERLAKSLAAQAKSYLIKEKL